MQLLRYLKETRDYGVQLGGDLKLNLIGYSDSDWAVKYWNKKIYFGVRVPVRRRDQFLGEQKITERYSLDHGGRARDAQQGLPRGHLAEIVVLQARRGTGGACNDHE